MPERLRAAAPDGTGRSFAMLADSERVLASVCEAVIGAAYLAFGIERVAPAVVAAFEAEIDEALENPVDYKSLLQERLAQRAEVVAYRIESEEGPAHERSFVAVAEVDGSEIGRGEGRTKKGAEQKAARAGARGDGRADAPALDLHEGLQVLPEPHQARVLARACRWSSGPNGSGKSNITDAVLWALGEQSPLAVRGQTMKDVIFAGGHGVKGSSAAEVEVVIDNSDGGLDTEFGEISIVRRLDREGEGEYRLNGARCRLVDVAEVLSDTGLGKEMHSVVSQGRVEAIVLSRPRERRLLIEEAAGPRQAPQAPPPRPAQARAHRGEPLAGARRGARGALAAAPAQAPGRGRRAARAPRAPDAGGALRAGARRRARGPLARSPRPRRVAGTARAEREEAEKLLAGVAKRREQAEEAFAALTREREELQARLFAARSARERIGIRLERAQDQAPGGRRRRRAPRAPSSSCSSASWRRRATRPRAPPSAIAALEKELAALDGERDERVRDALAELEAERAAGRGAARRARGRGRHRARRARGGRRRGRGRARRARARPSGRSRPRAPPRPGPAPSWPP